MALHVMNAYYENYIMTNIVQIGIFSIHLHLNLYMCEHFFIKQQYLTLSTNNIKHQYSTA